nr:efflux RND transporter periplasmic adaptor subunit [Desulfobulbaceae bacterium]
MKTISLLGLLIVVFGSTAFAQDPPPAKVVTTAIVQQEVAENNSFIGVFDYDRTSHLSSEVAGLVTEVHISNGDRVKAGAPIVTINTEMLDLEIALTRSKIEQIELKINYSEKNYQRLNTLYLEKGVSEKVFDDAFYAYQDALKEKQIVSNSIAMLTIQKNKSIIYAPFDGVVLEKNIDVGDWVQQGKNLVLLGSVKDLIVRVPVAETLLQFTQSGQEVPVQINAFSTEITGTIDGFDPVADEKTKNIFLKVRIPRQDKIAANMSATVFVPTSMPKTVSLIPRDALVKFQGKDFVYTIKDGKASILPVNIVSYLGNMIGADNPYFAAGMPIVVEGNERLRPDQAVVVAGEN